MKKCLWLCHIGARLWQKGGDWSKDDDGPTYDSLTWYGKLGYHMVVLCFKINGVTREDALRWVDEQA